MGQLEEIKIISAKTKCNCEEFLLYHQYRDTVKNNVKAMLRSRAVVKRKLVELDNL